MADRNFQYKQYLAPRFWPLWFAFFIGKLIAHLPLRIQLSIGSTLGILSYYALRKRRVVTEINIQKCFPELSKEQQTKLVKQSFRSNGKGLIEALRSWFRKPSSLKQRVTLEGEAHLQNALDKGKGVILLGGHFSTLDLIGSLTTLFFKADVLQRDHSNPLFNAFMTQSRMKLYGDVLNKDDIRGMVRNLRKNHIVWYATDQDYGRNHTVFVDFFGIPCSTLTSTMRLVKMSGATVLPFSHERTSDNRYKIRIHPAVEDFPSGDIKADAQRLNHILEANVRDIPEQYLWMHRRFKTTEERGQQNIYGQVRDQPKPQ